MAKPKIIWRVCEKETGRYASFHKRGWPSANYNSVNGPYCCHIRCDDEYIPEDVKTGNHGPLTVLLADHSEKPWLNKRLSKRFDTLAEAKAGVLDFLTRHPRFRPAD